jgi:hypothetical protein
VKKKIVMLVVFVLLLGGGVYWYATQRDQNLVLIGNLPASDLQAVKHAARKEIRRRAFRNVSWSHLNAVPGACLSYLQYKILRVTAHANGIVFVETGKTQAQVNAGWSGPDDFWLINSAQGWHLKSTTGE